MLQSKLFVWPFVWLFVWPPQVIIATITETEDFVIVTKVYNLQKMDKAVNFFQHGLSSKINVVDLSDGKAYTTIVNKPALRSDDWATFTKSVAQVDSSVTDGYLESLLLVQSQMNMTQQDFEDAMKILKHSSTNTSNFFFHEGFMAADRDQVDSFKKAQKKQVHNHFLVGKQATIQEPTKWYDDVIKLFGMTFSNQAIINKGNKKEFQTQIEKGVFMTSFGFLLLEGQKISNQANTITKEVEHFLNGVMNPEKNYLTRGSLSVTEIETVLKNYPDICLTLKEAFEPGRVPMTTAMPIDEKLLLADYYFPKKCLNLNSTGQLDSFESNIDTLAKIDNQQLELNTLKQEIVSLESIKEEFGVFKELLGELKKNKTFIQDQVTSKVNAKITEMLLTHFNLWIAFIVVIFLIAIQIVVIGVLAYQNHDLKKRANLADVRFANANMAMSAPTKKD